MSIKRFMDDRDARIASITNSPESIAGWLRSVEASPVTFDAKDVIWFLLEKWKKLKAIEDVMESKRQGIICRNDGCETVLMPESKRPEGKGV